MPRPYRRRFRRWRRRPRTERSPPTMGRFGAAPRASRPGRRSGLVIALVVALVAAAAPAAATLAKASATPTLLPLHAIVGDHPAIVDSRDRQVILRGVNLNSLGDYYQDDPKSPPVVPVT